MATNFLEAAGTNGFIGSISVAINLNGLASGAAATSTNTCTNGPAGTLGGAQKCQAWFQCITTAFTPTAGACLAGWWLTSVDGGTTFETLLSTPSTTITAVPRSPDFIIPMYEGGASVTANAIKFATGPFKFPYLTSKVVVQNFTGVALSSASHTITIGGVADQY